MIGIRHGCSVALAAVLVLAACTSGPEATRGHPSDDRGRAVPGSPSEDLEEVRAILDSIRIEP